MNTRGSLLIPCNTASASEPESARVSQQEDSLQAKLRNRMWMKHNYQHAQYKETQREEDISLKKTHREMIFLIKVQIAQNQGPWQGSHDVESSSLYLHALFIGSFFMFARPPRALTTLHRFYFGKCSVLLSPVLFPDVPFLPSLLVCVNSTFLCSYPVTSVIPAFVMCLPQLQ